jgi:hypothetical protein
MRVLWTLLFGPLLSLLPLRLRKSLPFYKTVNWSAATALSGLAEFILGVVLTLFWYDDSMTTWVNRAMDAALTGKLGPGVTDQAIGFSAYLVWASHPYTWCLGYVCIEGAIRLCGAAFTDVMLGTFPLFLLDKIFAKLFLPPVPKSVDFQRSDTDPSFFGAIWERLFLSRTRELPDELTVRKNASGEILEVHASRRKPDWTRPCIIRYAGNYYRLESATRSASPRRPFLYTLHRLPAGVPSRTVLLYNP